MTFLKNTKYIQLRNSSKRGIALTDKIQLYDKDGISVIWCYDENKKCLGEVILDKDNDDYK